MKKKKNDLKFVLDKELENKYKFIFPKSFTINRFYLGILIITIIFLNWLFLIILIHPESMNFIIFNIMMVIGTLNIIINTFNAFPKKE